jgi:hypothetical protein
MRIRDLFASDVTRDIPPVVYFHEQTPQKLADEVSEYIITGGWPADHPNHRRVPDGIHEQYAKLLTGIAAELDKPGGPELPNAWISGFYGSGKSSFAKLFGLALDGVALPDGTSLAEAWLRRDTSPRAAELRTAWSALYRKINPIAVVFDVGGSARDNEHIHAAAVRQVQKRLDYCSTEPLVADFELKLERDGVYARFEEVAARVLGSPWKHKKHRALAEEDFSLVMSEMFPEKYTDPMSWFTSRGGTHTRAESPEDAVRAIGDMLRFRKQGATLFLVIDEVSQYILAHKDRVDRLRAFATALGAGLKGQAWASRSSTRRPTIRSWSGPRTAFRPGSASTSPPPTSATWSTSGSWPRPTPARTDSAPSSMPIATTSSSSPTTATRSRRTSSSTPTRCCPATSICSCRSQAPCAPAPAAPRATTRPSAACSSSSASCSAISLLSTARSAR